ncbi:MAG: hypothetical protein LBS25_02860 [Candidatus Symbiothrix sp.]|jgi:hypothetical protein|nr:hypothetical protein [Candidatus Symbiothrix sp.]
MSNSYLTPLDISIILLYLGVLIFIGFYLKRLASRNLESYLLGGKSIPWYMLGLSNASGMFDISGTVWLVAITVVYGLKSIYIPWLWPVFNQIFLMVYLSAWLRRSECTTGAEWIGFRFGKDKGAVASHWIIVVFAILVGLSMLAYGFRGMAAGMIPALVIPIIPYFDNILPLYYFPIILVFSILGCIWGTYSAPETDMEVLKKFYVKTRPWGFWKPVHDAVIAENPDFQKNSSAKRDLSNVAVGIIWQTALVAAPIYLVLKQWWFCAIAVMIIGVMTVVLKKNCYDKLED